MSTTKKTLLIVDDDKDMIDAMVSIASPAHWEVLTASNPREARELLLSSKFDVVVTDFDMGEENGTVVLAAVREIHGPDVPVLLHTGKIENVLGDFTYRFDKLSKDFKAFLRVRETGADLFKQFLGAVAPVLMLMLSGCASMIGMGERQHKWVLREGIKKASQEEVNTDFASCGAAFGHDWNRQNACLYARGYVHEITYER